MYATRTALKRRDGVRRLLRLVSPLGGGILLQATAGGCQEYLSSAIDVLGQPLATGVGNALSSLVEALVLSTFI